MRLIIFSTKKIIFLGIETSCDETAAAVIRENEKGTADILSNVVSSQISEHKKFGGVVPELAARSHLEKIEIINKDTYPKKNKFFSSRRSINDNFNDYGRNISVIMIK